MSVWRSRRTFEGSGVGYMTVKFLLMKYENQGATVLIRESDGMQLASVQANQCSIITDGNIREVPVTRLFLDHDYALRYLKEVVAPKMAELPPGTIDEIEFEERDGDSRIVTPMGGIGRPH